MSVLRFENVSKQYPGGHAALEDVSFEVAEGEMLFVTGHSGAGKSTLLKLIHLSERPSRGAVLFAGKNLLKVRGGRIPMHRREVGAVYQDHRLLTDRTVMENVSLPLILRGDRRGDIGFPAARPLDDVGKTDPCGERSILEVPAPRRAEQSGGGKLAQLALANLPLIVMTGVDARLCRVQSDDHGVGRGWPHVRERKHLGAHPVLTGLIASQISHGQSIAVSVDTAQF